MKKYVFDDSTVHELHRISKLLYNTFSSADRQVLESDFSWTHKSEIDYSVCPEKYCDFRLGEYQVFIHKFRNGLFTLECYGFTPKNLKPFEVEKYNFDFYRNCFGRFHSFGDAKIAFADVVCDLATLKTQPLF